MRRILRNAKIYTVNKKRDWAEAVVIDDDKIVYVGSNDGADAYVQDGAEVKDMQGKMILPGFIDGHIHTLGAGVLPSGIILGGLTTKEDIFETIKKYINENPNEECYFGVGWLESIFGDKGPNKSDLDAITDKPIALISASCHTCWANSKALELAGITKDTPDPIPNVQFFMRDDNGEPTGYCIENKPLNMVFTGADYIPMDKVFPSLSAISQQLVSEGITTSAEVGIYEFLRGIFNEKLKGFVESDNYLGRIICSGDIAADPDTIAEKFEFALKWKEILTSDKFKLNFFKVLSDGTLENGSAACPNPYPQTGAKVSPAFTEEQEYEYMVKSYEHGLDYNIHAIGPDAVHRVLMAVKRVREEGIKDLRICMSHCTAVYDEDAPLFAKYDVFSNGTPVWIPVDSKEVQDSIEAITNATIMPLKSIKNAGAMLGFGSDFPTDPRGFNIFQNIECGITRQNLGEKDAYIQHEEERLELDDMIAGYTINNAYQIRMEDKIGSIEAGKYADMIVLNQNLFDVDTYDIHNVKVIETIFNGKTCFEA